MQKRISPANDLAFKKILASEDRKDISCGFIRDFWGFETTEQDLSITNPYNIRACQEAVKESGLDIVKLRQTILDVSFSVKLRDMQVELQVKREKYFSERSVYYACLKYCSNYNKRGAMEVNKSGRFNRYSSLRPVYSLNILDYIHFAQDDDALRIFILYDKKREKSFGKELLSVGYFELPKGKFESENQKYWRDFFVSGEALEGSPDYIKKAEGLLEYINLNGEEKEMFDALEKAQADYDAYLVTAYSNGKDEGVKLGEQRAAAKYQAEIAALKQQLAQKGNRE